MTEKTVRIRGRNYKRPDLTRLTYRQAEAMDLAMKMSEGLDKAGATAPWRVLAAFVPGLPEKVLHSLDLTEVEEAMNALDLDGTGGGEGNVSVGESSPS